MDDLNRLFGHPPGGYLPERITCSVDVEYTDSDACGISADGLHYYGTHYAATAKLSAKPDGTDVRLESVEDCEGSLMDQDGGDHWTRLDWSLDDEQTLALIDFTNLNWK